MTAFVMSLVFIFVAELGDKSMLLALAFATKYSSRTVLGGVFVATAINHLLVVLLGDYVTGFVSMQNISIFCSLAFIGFGLWTIRGDVLDDDDVRSTRYSPFWTVAIAFFLSEMGDKTQLATLTLAAEYKSVLYVWLGTTLGMVLADGVGIVLGKVLGNRIPENAIKWFAASVFVLFGWAGFYESIPMDDGMKIILTLSVVVSTVVLGYFVRRPNVQLEDSKSKGWTDI